MTDDTAIALDWLSIAVESSVYSGSSGCQSSSRLVVQHKIKQACYTMTCPLRSSLIPLVGGSLPIETPKIIRDSSTPESLSLLV